MIQTALSLLNALTDPVGFLWTVLLGASLWAVWRRRWTFLGFTGALLLFLQLIAGTNLSRLLIGRLEAPFDPRRHVLPDHADAVVMLGGTLDYGPRERLGINLGEPGDRILTAVDLMREGRAPVLVLCSAPYLLNGEWRPDSELIAEWLHKWQLPTGKLLRMPIGRNTHDEALELALLAAQRDWDRVLLVTSAYHLRRAEAAFHHAGLTNVIPVGCDFQGVDPASGRFEWLGIPRVGPLIVLNYWTHEQVGWWYYRFRGWL